MRRCRQILLLAALFIVVGTTAAAERDPILEDHYIAERDPVVDRPVLGDLTVAGLRPRIDARVAGDVLASGGWLTIAGEVADDVRAAGGWLELDNRVGDHVALAGFSVTLGPRADIGGRAWLGGDRVRIDGRVRGPLRIAAREVVIAGRIDGPVRIVARDLRILASARIDGDLVYRAPAPAEVEPGATVGGELTFHRSERPPSAGTERRPPSGPGLGGILLWTLALLIPGALLRLALPGPVEAGHRTLLGEPLLSLGIGGLLLFVVPLAALALCVFVITIPLALATLVALLPLALIGYLVTAGALGERALQRLMPERTTSAPARIAALAMALLALAIAGLVPYLGGLVAIAATLFGTGAVAVSVRRRARPAET